MTNLFATGIRPYIDTHLLNKAQESRDYGDYWPASSSGYCMRKLIFDRLKVPYVKEDPRKQRVLTSGSIMHEWIQGITKEAGISVAQELELRDEELKVLGHIDDLVFINGKLMLYDYKTVNSRAFSYMKGKPISHYHKMQLGSYMYMLNKDAKFRKDVLSIIPPLPIGEARILKISRDDLRQAEQELVYDAQLQKMVYEYWSTLNGFWRARTLPKCTCDKYEGGFMARENYNPYFFDKQPCSIEWAKSCLVNGKSIVGGWKYEH